MIWAALIKALHEEKCAFYQSNDAEGVDFSGVIAVFGGPPIARCLGDLYRLEHT
jgi:hypothetical protein